MCLVDYAHGDDKYLMALSAAEQVDGGLLVQDLYASDSIIRDRWPLIVVSFPMLARYPYHARSGTEAAWRVVL